MDRSVRSSRPTQRDIDELIAFLPRLSADGVAPIRDWGGGETDANGAYVMPWPNYEDLVTEFFAAAGQDCWKAMPTYCVRGERFCDGHWAAMIEGGHVQRLLERLAELQAQNC